MPGNMIFMFSGAELMIFYARHSDFYGFQKVIKIPKKTHIVFCEKFMSIFMKNMFFRDVFGVLGCGREW